MMSVDEELARGGVPASIGGMEVGPVGGGGVSEMVEPQSQDLFLIVLLQCGYHLLQRRLQLSAFPDA